MHTVVRDFGRRCTLPSLVLGLCLSVSIGALPAPAEAHSENEGAYLKRAKVFLAAGDYRRALDAVLLQVWYVPSAASYLYLTYVYHAIDGYLEHLAKKDQWVRVGHLYLNLSARGAEDLANPPDILDRIAKEVVQGAARKQSDISAAMAARLDEKEVARLWQQQKAWRGAHPDDWWAGVPSEWGW